jgi:transcriptional regulator with XRE-family HTH domain
MNNHDFLIAVGSKIREQRRLQNITCGKLSELCGINERTLTTTELGKKATDLATLNRIANALNMPPHALLMFDQLTPTTQSIQVDGPNHVTIQLSIKLI